MEQPSSSSKVTVEYYDPFNVYQLLSPGLLARLPLRNLHWESHAGPLRSIQSLHIDLVPGADQRPVSSASYTDLSRVKSNESVASGDDGFRVQPLGKSSEDKGLDTRSGASKALGKGRRHQIPGLRQTPYLKLFFLRCDDNETYKAQARKQVREWIKDHTPPMQSTAKISAQENHDAFEFLIVHVIVPNTAAATQPRTSSKGSSTILEKLRADFNGTSKSAIDRVAQIRIGINDVPYDILPRVVPAIPGSYTETAQEHEASWQDLIAKFKYLILSSFDMRVSQYEEDIREKDAQRALPGWNFCTFFVLKEGLARGFENVGLVEDSLVGYDELAVGLDAIIREQAATGTGAEHGESFLPYTKDLMSQVLSARADILQDNGIIVDDNVDSPIDLQHADGVLHQDEILLIAERKQYRDLILANNISIFDFRCYLFSRQLALLLRMGNAVSSREELIAKIKEQRDTSILGVAARQPLEQLPEESENLLILSEICRRALLFIASITRIMRDDLIASILQTRKEISSADDRSSKMIKDPATLQAIENVVSSFTFSVTQQILAQTATRSLPIPPSTLAPSGEGLDEPKVTIPEPKTMMHPARSSSLISERPPVSPNEFPGRRATFSETAPGSNSPFLKTGLEELAANRAQLYILSRGVLERLGSDREWSVGWNPSEGENPTMEEINLNSESVGDEESAKKISPSLHGMDNKLLRTALSNQGNFYRLYETLTDKALRHFTVANHIQSVQTNMADLAVLKFFFKDYAGAASYFYRITPFYGEGGWENVEMSLLEMYSKCLKELNRYDEYVRVTLKLLAKGVAAKKDTLQHQSAFKFGPSSSFSSDEVSVDGYLTELLTVIPKLQHEVNVPLRYLFSSIEVDGTAKYDENRDSFSLELEFRYLLQDELHIDNGRARLVPVAGGQGRDIWLDTDGPMAISNGIARLQVHSNVIISGIYVVKQVVLQSSKMTLTFENEAILPVPSTATSFFKCPRIMLYHSTEAFHLKISASRNLHLDRQRFLELDFSSGWNHIRSGELHVRAATAGLRLQTSEIKVIGSNLEILKKSDPGIIRFGPLASNSFAKILLPFSIEQETSDISIKIEISYTTSEGTFFHANSSSVSILLPLGVNVQDVFKHKALFSKFTVSSANANAIRLLRSNLADSEAFEASSGGEIEEPVQVLRRQPASLLFQITRRSGYVPPPIDKKKKQKKPSLLLNLQYTCLEEEIDEAVTKSLAQALQDNAFSKYGRFLTPIVLFQLQSRFSPYDTEQIALLSEISTTPLSSINWALHFQGLGKDTPALLAKFINAWLAAHPTIPLLLPSSATSAYPSPTIRTISIPVDIPPITTVHTATLTLNSLNPSPSNESTAILSQPLAATLHLKWTRAWDVPYSPHRSRDLSFSYELSAPSDTWLLGGRRKGNFVVPANVLRSSKSSEKTLEFPVLMIPVREGYLPFPHLEIRHIPNPHGVVGEEKVKAGKEWRGHEDGVDEEQPVTSEMDYKNTAQTIRVFGDVVKTTVSLDASGPGGGAWLLEWERRGDAAGVA